MVNDISLSYRDVTMKVVCDVFNTTNDWSLLSTKDNDSPFYVRYWIPEGKNSVRLFQTVKEHSDDSYHRSYSTYSLRTKNPTDFSWILALLLTLVCHFLLLSYTHLSLKQGQQRISTHILQIPKQTLSKVETYVCALTLKVISILIVSFTGTMSSYNLFR